MKRILAFMILAMAMAAQGQLKYTPPPALAYCFNVTLGWLPVAGLATGTALGFSPPPYGLYFTNSGTLYPADCDASGNLIISANTGVGTITSGTQYTLPMYTLTGSGTTLGASALVSNASGQLVSPALVGNPTAPTQAETQDTSNSIATDQFVIREIEQSMGTTPINAANDTVGTLSFDSIGSPAAILRVTTVSGGAITALSVLTAGGGTTAYKAGDLVGCVQTGSNNDAVLQVATLASGGIGTLNVLYGGTGYTASTGCGSSPAFSGYPFTFTLSGLLAQSETYIMPFGTFFQNSDQWIVNNNTTGAFTVTFKIGTASNTATGTGVVVPQGTNNSTATFVQTDGSTDVWLVASARGTLSNTTPVVNTAACIKAVGPPVQIGYCATALSGGPPPTCTCN